MDINSDEIKQNLKYFFKSFAYSLLIGSSIIAISRNYKKAMMNEEEFSAYKFFRKMSESEHLS